MFNVDGYIFDFPCDLERKVKTESSSNSGLMMSKKILNDVIASYVSYSVKIVVPQGQEDKYTRLFNLLSTPAEERVWTFPYNQGTITFYGKVDSISDKFYRTINGKNIWRDISFEVSATRPIEEQIQTWLIYEYYTNVTSDLDVNFIIDNQSLTVNLTADEGYEINNVVVMMGEDDITATAYDNGVVTISAVTNDVTITATAELIE